MLLKPLLRDEDYADYAQALIDAAVRRLHRVVGPPLLLTEATNGLFQARRRGDLTRAEADHARRSPFLLPIRLPRPVDLTQRAYEFATRHRLANVYDSHYVVLAELLGVEHWTGDRRQVNSLRVIAPWVRWIGDYPISASKPPLHSQESP